MLTNGISTANLAIPCQHLAEQVRKIPNYKLSEAEELLLSSLKSIWLGSKTDTDFDYMLAHGLSIDNLALLLGLVTAEVEAQISLRIKPK